MNSPFFKPEDFADYFEYPKVTVPEQSTLAALANAKRDAELERLREALREANSIVSQSLYAGSLDVLTLSDLQEASEKWLSKYGQDK